MRVATFVIISTVLLFTGNTVLAQNSSLKNNSKVLFLGNSITYSGAYINFIDSYFTYYYPDLNIEFINVGLPSETVSGLSEKGHAEGRFARPDLHERLNRVLKQTKPDVVFACYGMNDGIYLPFNDDRFTQFKNGILWMHNEVFMHNAEIIHVTPPIYDEQKGAAYANVLDIYSHWLLSLQFTNNWEVIDIHQPMQKALENKRETDSTFAFAHDGIHPNLDGHWEMAKPLLYYLDAKHKQRITQYNEFIKNNTRAKEMHQLIEKRQHIMKDAWLTQTGHNRPEMSEGLAMPDAIKQVEFINQQLK